MRNDRCRRLSFLSRIIPLSSAGAQKGLSIFHKKYEQHNKRHRQGYAEDLGMTLSRVAKVSQLESIVDEVAVTFLLFLSCYCEGQEE